MLLNNNNNNNNNNSSSSNNIGKQTGQRNNSNKAIQNKKYIKRWFMKKPLTVNQRLRKKKKLLRQKR